MKYTLLNIDSYKSGCTGDTSTLIIVSDNGIDGPKGKLSGNIDDRPTIGHAIQVVDTSDYQGLNWWRTSQITEILHEEETDEKVYVEFKTLNSTYSWTCKK